VRVLDVPIVEGGVAAAVAAESGDDLDAVIRAATGEPAETSAPHAGAAEATVVLTDPEGLHARPAAALVRLAAGFDARVTINGADASSLLRIIAMGIRNGEEVTVRAEGDQADEAVAAVSALLAGASS
jgi:PTS hybrid protein